MKQDLPKIVFSEQGTAVWTLAPALAENLKSKGEAQSLMFKFCDQIFHFTFAYLTYVIPGSDNEHWWLAQETVKDFISQNHSTVDAIRDSAHLDPVVQPKLLESNQERLHFESPTYGVFNWILPSSLSSSLAQIKRSDCDEALELIEDFVHSMLCLLELFMSQPREFGEPALDALFELQENTKDAIVAVIRQEGIPGLAEALEGVLEGTIPVIKVEKTDDD